MPSWWKHFEKVLVTDDSVRKSPTAPRGQIMFLQAIRKLLRRIYGYAVSSIIRW